LRRLQDQARDAQGRKAILKWAITEHRHGRRDPARLEPLEQQEKAVLGTSQGAPRVHE
jgi:hypothetical protein